MGKIFSVTILFLLFSINCNCQSLPLNSLEEPNNGGYLKDIDNVLPFWVGTWKGVEGNKEYTFEFVKFQHHLNIFSPIRSYYIDELVGKFKVVNLTTNEVLYDDLSLTNFQDYKISLSSYGNNKGYVFLFVDNKAHCDNMTKFTLIKDSTNPNQIKYLNFEYTEFITSSDCIYPEQEDIPMFLPKTNLILTRQ